MVSTGWYIFLILLRMSSNLVKKMTIHRLFLLFDTLGILLFFFVLPTLSFAVAAPANQDAVVRTATSRCSPHSSWWTSAHKGVDAHAQGQSPLACGLSVGFLALTMGLNSSETSDTRTRVAVLCSLLNWVLFTDGWNRLCLAVEHHGRGYAQT